MGNRLEPPPFGDDPTKATKRRSLAKSRGITIYVVVGLWLVRGGGTVVRRLGEKVKGAGVVRQEVAAARRSEHVVSRDDRQKEQG